MKCRSFFCSVLSRLVAPHAGAWVEIRRSGIALWSLWSLPTRERGLKYFVHNHRPLFLLSLPTRERGLKSEKKSKRCRRIESLPTRERGLKFANHIIEALQAGSLPTRERGLKFISLLSKFDRQSVAPHAGAWVEILRQIPLPCSHNRRSPRGSVG